MALPGTRHQHTFASHLWSGSRNSWFPEGFGAPTVTNPELDCHSWPGTLRKEQVKLGLFVDSYFLAGRVNLSCNIGVGGE